MRAMEVFFPVFIVSVVAITIASVVFSAAPSPAAPVVSAYARTIEHDGHKFVVYRAHGGIIHHPSCHCLLTPAEKE